MCGEGEYVDQSILVFYSLTMNIDETSFKIDRRVPIVPQIYARLQHMIVTMALQPRQVLSENELAERFDVSRTPVREALRKLVDYRLIDVFPQQGSVVSPIRIREIIEGQFVREALETAVVKKAARVGNRRILEKLGTVMAEQKEWARKISVGECLLHDAQDSFMASDESFHRILTESIEQERSWSVIQSIKWQMDRVRYLSLTSAEHIPVLIKQHEKIYTAVLKSDEDEAIRQVQIHLSEVFKTIQHLYHAHADLFEGDGDVLEDAGKSQG